MDVEEDVKYFGLMNIYPVLDALWKADMKERIGKVRNTLAQVCLGSNTKVMHVPSD